MILKTRFVNRFRRKIGIKTNKSLNKKVNKRINKKINKKINGRLINKKIDKKINKKKINKKVNSKKKITTNNNIKKSINKKTNKKKRTTTNNNIKKYIDKNIYNNTEGLMEELNLLVDNFNNITRLLNKNTLTDKNIYRSERLELLEKIIKYKDFDKNKKIFLLPRVTPELYVSYNIAIVGNSKSLLYYDYGNEIDSHGDVLRFNYSYLGEELKQHIGTKGTIHVTSLKGLQGGKPPNHPKIDNMNYNILGEIKDRSIIVFNKNNSSSIIKKVFNRRCLKNNNKLYTIRWDLKYFKNVSSYYKITASKDPQCGSGFILLLVDLGLYPDVYGFDTKKCDDNFYYYWDTVNKKCSKLSTTHNYGWEFKFVNSLNNDKHINLKTFNL